MYFLLCFYSRALVDNSTLVLTRLPCLNNIIIIIIIIIIITIIIIIIIIIHTPHPLSHQLNSKNQSSRKWSL